MTIPITITIIFMLLGVLLSISIIYGRMHWILKSMFIISVLLFSYGTYYLYMTTQGWAASNIVPTEKSEFLWAKVNEPSKIDNDPGSIYIWVIPPEETITPRAYKLPYSKNMHKNVNSLKENVSKGKFPKIKITLDTAKKGSNDVFSFGTPNGIMELPPVKLLDKE